jgi:hypothetical protein
VVGSQKEMIARPVHLPPAAVSSLSGLKDFIHIKVTRTRYFDFDFESEKDEANDVQVEGSMPRWKELQKIDLCVQRMDVCVQ